MTWYAVTRILHGTDDTHRYKGDRNLDVFEPGEEVTGLDDKVMDDLIASGSVTEQAPEEVLERETYGEPKE